MLSVGAAGLGRELLGGGARVSSVSPIPVYTRNLVLSSKPVMLAHVWVEGWMLCLPVFWNIRTEDVRLTL